MTQDSTINWDQEAHNRYALWLRTQGIDDFTPKSLHPQYKYVVYVPVCFSQLFKNNGFQDYIAIQFPPVAGYSVLCLRITKFISKSTFIKRI